MSVKPSVNTVDAVKNHIANERDLIFRQLAEIVAFNSVHNEPGLEDQTTAAAEWTARTLKDSGLEVDEFRTVDGSITLLGTHMTNPDAPTVLLYCHYDVVPSGDPSAWTDDPFTLTEREDQRGLRWYGRGAADCKGNLVMHLAALRAVHDAGGTALNLKVLVEGSEERGGEGLDQLISTRPELFAADVILIADSGNTSLGVPTLTTALRGGAQVTVTVDTLRAGVHSGLFGGGAPDAVAALVRILDSLRDEHGRTIIDGVDSTARWEGERYDASTFRSDAGVLDGVELMGDGDDPADLVWARPAVTVTGFTSTPVAEAYNAVPATASAQLNLRVPPGADAAEIADKLREHLINHAPWGAQVTVTISDINAPFSTDVTGPAVSTLSACLSASYDGAPTAAVGSGGSIPLCTALMDAFPSAELALFGVEEPLCTIHSPDESVSPDEIRDIATAEALFLLTYGK